MDDEDGDTVAVRAAASAVSGELSQGHERDGRGTPKAACSTKSDAD